MPRLNRIYTKTGDEGTTGLGGGQRVPKDSRRVVTYGTVDELNSQIGVALATGLCERLTTELSAIQNELFDLGSDLCWPSDDPRRARIPTVEARHVEKLEALIDEFNDVVGDLTNFLLPGGAAGRGAPARRADDLPPSRAGGGPPGARRGDRRVRAPLPQPALGRAVRDGPLREPRARRPRAALAARAPDGRSARGEVRPAELGVDQRRARSRGIGLERRAERERGGGRTVPSQPLQAIQGLLDRRPVCPAGTHQSTRWAVASRSNHSRRCRRTSTCAVLYVNARRASIEDHTLMLIRKRSSSVGRMSVALPESVCNRQMKPGLASARRLIGSSCATNPAISGESTGASIRPTFSCASSNPSGMRPR